MNIIRRVRRRLFPKEHGKGLPLIRPAERGREHANYLFVCGLHRSGTSLIERRLRAICCLAALDAPVPESEGQHLQDVFPPARDHGGPGRFAFAEAMHPPPPGPEDAAAARARILACWTPFLTDDADWLIEKSPPNLTKIPWLRAVFPGSRFLIVARDPRAAAGATAKWTSTRLTDLVYHWHVAYDAALGALGDDCMTITYEQFCDDTDGTLERVVTRFGLPRRAEPLAIEDRFRQVQSSNTGYLEPFEGLRLGRGAWTEFGYDLA